MFLDEPLSGIDNRNAQSIVNALFGHGGLLRTGKTTVLIVSTSSMFNPLP
jgi:ABC-type Mn2+/Zn2+ transport system ATPase subunit